MCNTSRQPASHRSTDGDRRTRATAEISRSELFEALSNDRRRAALSVLAEEGGSLDVSTLARRVATREAGAAASASGERTERVHVSLYHVHLPKLEALGLIAYDPDRELVESLADDRVEALL
jgi:DNA-binding transcriptional ArsR family regulator